MPRNFECVLVLHASNFLWKIAIWLAHIQENQIIVCCFDCWNNIRNG